MIMELKGLKRYQRNGRWYAYHRPSGIRIEPPNVFGTDAFVVAFRAAEQQHKAHAAQPGTLGHVIRSYRASNEFSCLADRTRRDYLGILDWLRGLDEMPIRQIDAPFVVKLRNKALAQRKWRFANYMLVILSNLFRHAIEIGSADANPVRDVRSVKRPKNSPVPNRAWSETEKAIVIEKAPPHLLGPIAIARWAGLRKGDVLRLSKTSYRKGTISLVTSKRQVPLQIVCPSPLRAILDSLPRHDAITFLANSRGRPWTLDGFQSSFSKFITRLEEDGLVERGLTFHGLRTSLAEELRTLGFDVRTIADALGQRDMQSAQHYTRNVDPRISLARVKVALEGSVAAPSVDREMSPGL